MSKITKVFIALISCAFSINGAFAAPSPSFDCAKAGTKVEKAICSDEKLADLDKSLSEAYISLKKELTTTEVKALKDSQRQWVKQRDSNCGSDINCLKKAYANRIEQLQQQGKGRKYAGFMFNPKYGTSYLEGGGSSVIELLYNNFPYLKEYKADMIMSVRAIENKRYVVSPLRFSFVQNDEVYNYAIIDMNLKQVVKLLLPGKTIGHPLMSEGYPLGMLGCFEDSPPFIQDINQDGYSEIFILTGGGAGHLQGEVEDYMDISMFDGKTYEKQFTFRLKDMDLRAFKHDDWMSFQMISAMNDNNPGKQSYGKMYFGDFDQDNLMNILLWKRNYESTKTEMWPLKSEEFEMYEEQKDGEGFKKQEITAEDARKMLKANNLTWLKGFPNGARCELDKGNTIVIPKFVLDDPVLRQ